ncbi:hydrogenase-1 expression HyaE [Rhodomicrobium lacus]|uniref:hydrogenase-1 expression HyaE n=1 Tax=Rhodomicrobium lacus TaxID=2498452 RepID=UPI000F8DF324|nr:hydrogenase-1 expression HyaE [Rhodomicrobium lacus]
MTSPLIEALPARHGFATVTEVTLDAFLAVHADSVLFFPGDTDRLVESADVAVILPELLKSFPHVAPALVEKSAERALQLRFRFNAFPALVFLRGDGYLGAITRVLNWPDYIAEIRAILASDPSAPPPYKFPDHCVPAANGSAPLAEDHSE